MTIRSEQDQSEQIAQLSRQMDQLTKTESSGVKSAERQREVGVKSAERQREVGIKSAERQREVGVKRGTVSLYYILHQYAQHNIII